MKQRVIGVPREIKEQEYRVALVPSGAYGLSRSGHTVVVESGAGEGSGISDGEFREAGAEIVPKAAEVFARADLIVKVKEPQQRELQLIEPRHTVFTYFHFAASRELTLALVESGATCVAYETIEDDHRHLPLLTPMSEVAGRMAVLAGCQYLQKSEGGRGILMTGVPGVEPARVVVLGGGVVGSNAARVAAGLGAQVHIFDIDLDRLRYLDEVMPANVTTRYSNPFAIRNEVARADLVVGAVLVHGARAPVLVPREYLAEMQNGSVIVDVAVDQGGCVETCRPTTHHAPTYVVDGIVHYCVANMPGAVARTSTFALTNATFPYLQALADEGLRGFAAGHAGRAKGLNIHRGKIYHEGVSSAFHLDLAALDDVLHEGEDE